MPWYQQIAGTGQYTWTGPNVPYASAADWAKIGPTGQSAYQAAVTATGNEGTWADFYNQMQNKWPSWTMPSRAGWTAANYQHSW
jgi:hypothetical protein